LNYLSAMEYRIVHNGTTYKVIGRAKNSEQGDPWFDCGFGHKTLSAAIIAKREAEGQHGGTWRVVDSAEQAYGIKAE
jgi:hypothetical protein